MHARRSLVALTVLAGLGCGPRPTANLSAVPQGGSEPTVVAPEQAESPEEDLPRWVSLSIEQTFGCAVESTGAIYCWGQGPAASMQLRELPPQPPPNPLDYRSTIKWGPASRVEGVDDATALSTATNLACAIVEDGRVRCWGSVRWGSPMVFDVPRIAHATDLAISDGESCVLEEDGSLWCWGEEAYGMPRLRLEQTVAYDVTHGFACALGAQGDLACWGRSVRDAYRYGQLSVRNPGSGRAQGQAPPAPTPPPVNGNGLAEDDPSRYPDFINFGPLPETGVVALELTDAGGLCVLHGDGSVRCSERSLLYPNSEGKLQFEPVQGVSEGRELASSRQHSCVRTREGGARCWGVNNHGQLGDGTTTARSEAVSVAGLEGVTSLALSPDQSCALTESDEILCWGFDQGEAIHRETMHVHTLEGLRARSIHASGRSTCALDDAGVARCWGSDAASQHGVMLSSTPAAMTGVDLGKGLAGMLASWEFCVLGANGKLSCGRWDSTGGDDPELSFNLVDAYDHVRDFAAGPPPMCALMGANKTALRCAAATAELPNAAPEKSLPRPTQLSASNMRACVIHSGGKVSCFGEIHYWNDNGRPPRDIAKIDAVRGAKALASANSHDCALSPGKVQCWYGRVDTEWRSDGSGPKHVRYAADRMTTIPLDDPTQITAGGNRICALERSGKPRCWSDNTYNDDITWLETPELDDIAELAAGTEHVCARHRDGRVTCWGEDIQGQLGRLPSRVYLKPTALPVP